MKKEDIKLKDIDGTWYIIDELIYKEKHYYLLESQEWGDEIPCIITDDKFTFIYMNTYNGFDDLILEL